MNVGYMNENKIIFELNRKQFCELSNHWKEILIKMFGDIYDDEIIKCRLIGRECKTDIEICIRDQKRNVSIKSGDGVSVHYEHIESFLEFLKLINISNESLLFLKKFQYGIIDENNCDNKLISTKDLKTFYNDEINILNNELNNINIIEKIIYRCIIKGRSPYHQEIDYLYYGDEKIGYILSKEELIKYLPRVSIYTKSIHAGPLTFQAANRNVSKESFNHYKKDYIQIKWRTIKKDILSILNR